MKSYINNNNINKDNFKKEGEENASVINIDLSKGTTEGNPADDNDNNNNGNDDISLLSQFALIFIISCEALTSATAVSSLTSFTPSTSTEKGWLIYISFYIGQLISTVLIALIPAVAPSINSNRRPLLLLSLAGTAACQVAYGMSNSVPLWVATRALCGFFTGATACARAALGAQPDMHKLFICASLAYNSGITVGSSLYTNFRQIFTGDDGAPGVPGVPPLHPFFLDFPQAPVGLGAAFFVLLVLVFASFCAKNQDCSADAAVPKEQLEEGCGRVAPRRRFLLVGGFVFVYALFAYVYSGALTSVWFVSEKGLTINENSAALLCFHFMSVTIFTHVVLSFICTNTFT